MVKNSDHARQQMLTDAFKHLQSAMDLLDGADAPGHIAAHIDLAACKLEELLPAGKVASVRPADLMDGAWPTALPS